LDGQDKTTYLSLLDLRKLDFMIQFLSRIPFINNVAHRGMRFKRNHGAVTNIFTRSKGLAAAM
jgi:hypothetical protein